MADSGSDVSKWRGNAVEDTIVAATSTDSKVDSKLGRSVEHSLGIKWMYGNEIEVEKDVDPCSWC